MRLIARRRRVKAQVRAKTTCDNMANVSGSDGRRADAFPSRKNERPRFPGI